MRVVNFAHGEFLMLGMYLAFWSFTLLGPRPLRDPAGRGARSSSSSGSSPTPSSCAGSSRPATTSRSSPRWGCRPRCRTWPSSLWTGDFRFVRPWHSAVVIRIGEAAFNLSQVVAFLVAVLFTAALVAFMKWTQAGRIMRATAQDVEAATLMGIDTDRVYRLALVHRPGLRRRRGGADVAALLGVSHRGAPVRAARLRGGGAGRPRRHGRRPARQPDRGRASRCSAPTTSAPRGRKSSTSCSSSRCWCSAPPASSASAGPRPSAPDAT